MISKSDLTTSEIFAYAWQQRRTAYARCLGNLCLDQNAKQSTSASNFACDIRFACNKQIIKCGLQSLRQLVRYLWRRTNHLSSPLPECSSLSGGPVTGMSACGCHWDALRRTLIHYQGRILSAMMMLRSCAWQVWSATAPMAGITSSRRTSHL